MVSSWMESCFASQRLPEGMMVSRLFQRLSPISLVNESVITRSAGSTAVPSGGRGGRIRFKGNAPTWHENLMKKD